MADPIWHDIFETALGLVLSAMGWLILRFISKLDAMAKTASKHSIEIRDCRADIANVRGHLDLEQWEYESVKAD